MPSAHGRSKTATLILDNKGIQTRQQKECRQGILIGLLCILLSVFHSYQDTNNEMRSICVEEKNTKIIFFRREQDFRQISTHVECEYRTYALSVNKKDFVTNIVKTQNLVRMTGRGFGSYGISQRLEKRDRGRPSKQRLAAEAAERKAMDSSESRTTAGSQSSMLQFTPTTPLTLLTPEKPLMTAKPSIQDNSTTANDKIKNAPIMKTVNNETTTDGNTPSSTTYITRVQYRRKVSKTPDVIKFMKIIAAALMQYNKSIQLLPFDDKDKNNPLVTPRDIPDEVEEFQIYVPYAQVTRRGWLFMRFKIRSDTPLWQLKQNKGIRAILDRSGIFLDQMYLTSVDNLKIGGFLMSHCQYTRREQANKEINDWINMDESENMAIQLTPHLYWHGTGGNKVSTRLLAIECSRENGNEIRERIYRKMMNVPETLKYGNTRHFRYLPFMTTATITDDAIRNSVMLQNQYLLNVGAVTIRYTNNVTWKVPDTNLSFKEMVLTVETKDKSNNKLFNNVEIATGYNKVYLLTFKETLEEATIWIDEFIAKLKINSTTSTQWKALTGHPRVIQRIDRVGTSDAEKAYSVSMIKDLNIGGGSQSEDRQLNVAPVKQAWNRVHYGPVETEEIIQEQTQTSMSTLTPQEGKNRSMNDIETRFKKFEKTVQSSHNKSREEMLAEIKAMTTQSEIRTKSYEVIVKNNESVVNELLSYTKAQGVELASQKESIASIDKRTIATSDKMDVLDERTIATSEKMDVLNTSMNEFMTQISKTVTSLRDEFQSISYDGDDPNNYYSQLGQEKMDIEKDSILGFKRRLPSSAARGSLRDEGNQK